MKPKEFQEHSVNAVIEGLATSNGVYALADEVGLGKTLVCAEVARRLISNLRKERVLLFYIAPSIELIDQNLKSITKYLRSNFSDSKIEIISSISRISKLPLDIGGRNTGKRTVYVVGLSPETSFNLRGAGLKDERAYIAALFGYKCSREWKMFLRKFFWCIGQSEQDYFFKKRIEQFSNLDSLGILKEWRTGEEFRILENKLIKFRNDKSEFSSKENRALISEIRRKIVSYLISSKSALPDFVVFDEWHKYKNTCFDRSRGNTQHLVGRLLESCRYQNSSKVLFVSATPFTVNYKDGDNTVASSPQSGDLKDLLSLFWNKEEFSEKYQQLEEKQRLFLESVSNLLSQKNAAEFESLKLNASFYRDQYEKELRKYCVRTERPKTKDLNFTGLKPAKWTQEIFSRSITSFLKKFSKYPHVRTPVTSMWMDGHDFPEEGYEGLKGVPESNIKGHHWKMSALLEQLKADYVFDDSLHSFQNPPLWLKKESPLLGKKHLIFSEYKFVPNEICNTLRASGFGVTKSSKNEIISGSVLGFYPLKKKRRVGSYNLDKSIHFPFFYPFLFLELEESEFVRIRDKNEILIRKTIERSDNAIDCVFQIERVFSKEAKTEEISILRETLLDSKLKIPSSRRYKEYLLEIVFGDINDYLPSRMVSRITCKLRKHFAVQTSKVFEQAALDLGEGVFHIFVSREAQDLKRKAKKLVKLKFGKGWNSFLRFALWYSDKFKLEATLDDFTEQLILAINLPEDILKEVCSAMTLRKGSVGTKYVRSFHDKKIEDFGSERDSTTNLKSIRAAFNSPFPPYVLASTSVGQEGLDFHRYCDSIVHWNPPSSPSVLRQREGRLDRYNSLQVRIARGLVPLDGVDALNGLSPDFVVYKDGKRLNQPKVKVLFLPFTSQENVWVKCLERMHYDDLLIGAPDPISDEKMLLDVIQEYDESERIKRLQILQEFSICLNPNKLKLAK